MEQPEYIISLEIGSSAVKVAAAEFNNQSSPLTILSVATQPLVSGVRYGRIQNVEDVTSATMQAIESLMDTPALADRNIVGVYAGIGGRSLASIKASASLTLPDEREITADIIERLKEDALESVPEGLEPLEIIPLSFTVDGVEARRPIGSWGTRVAAQFTIVVCDPINGRNIERVVNKKLNLDIYGFIVRPLAVAKIALTVDDTKPGVMLADIGAETTTVSIFKNGALQYLATIPMGSRNITRDLALGLGIVEEKAEDIKRRLGNAMPEQTVTSPEQSEIDNYIQARAAEIVANIVAHINFAGFSVADLRAGIVVTGRGAKLRNFCQLLKMQSQLPVRIATLPAGVRIADPAINASDNIDIIATSVIGRAYALAPDASPCTVVEEPEPEPEPVKPAQQPAAGTSYRVDDTDSESFNSYRIDEGSQSHGKTRQVDDEDLLLDDEDAERRRAERAAAAAARARREESKKADSQRPAQRKPGLFDRVKSTFNRIVNDDNDGDGNDLDE